MKNNLQYEILTPTGFQDFSGMRTVSHDKYIHIIVDGYIEFKCSYTHKFIVNGSEIFANDLTIGMHIDSNEVTGKITNIEYNNSDITLYDIVNVSNGNLFIANDLFTHNCDFLSSGMTVIEPEILNWYENESGYIIDPIEKRGPGGDIWIWKYPNYSKTYVTVVDTSRGDGADYSTITVWDLEAIEQVAELKSLLTPADLGRIAVSLSSEYNNALLVIENTGIGYATVQVALDMRYTNLFYSYRNDPFLDDNIQVKKMYDLKDKSEMVPGFTNSHKSRPIVISKIETYLSEKSVIFHSKRMMQELRTFLWVKGRAEAQVGYNDDLVFPLGILLFVRDTALKLRHLGIELTKLTISKTHKSVYVPKRTGPDQWKMQVGNQNVDLKWLL